MRIRALAGVATVLLALGGVGAPPAAAQQTLDLEQAARAVEAAEAEARRNGWNLTIAIADAEGVPIVVRRMDGASARTHEIAMAKIRTVLASGMPSGDYGRALAEGRVDSIPNGITFEGGYPVRMGGEIVGAMSASGARGSEDAQAVRTGLQSIGVQF